MLSGLEQSGGPAEGHGGAEREPAAEALGEGDHVGQDTLVGLVLEPVPGAADTRLHLVQDEQSPVAAVIARAAFRYPAGGTTTPFSPWIGSMITKAVSSVTAAARAWASP